MATDPPQTAPTGTGERAPGAVQAVGVVLDDTAIRRALIRISHEILERIEDVAALYLVGIPNGGVPLARQVARNLEEIADLSAT